MSTSSSSSSQNGHKSTASTESSTVVARSQDSQEGGEDGQNRQSGSSNRAQNSKYERFMAWWDPWRVIDGRYDNFEPFDLESFPDGYPRLAALMDSDINTRLYRRFGLVRNRLLLHKQDQISGLAEKLADLDKKDETMHPERLSCRRYDEELGDESQRSEILQSLDHALKDYDALLLREHAITSIPRPTTRNHRAIFDWVYNNKPLVREEYQYLYNKRDFLLLGNQQDDWFRSFQERIWNLGHIPIFKRIMSSESHTSDSHSTYSSNEKANLAIKLFLALAMTTLLMLPVVLLYVLKFSTGVKLAILLLFVLAFSMAILLMTNARRHEAFAATAAYAAVLVVFLANLPIAPVQ